MTHNMTHDDDDNNKLASLVLSHYSYRYVRVSGGGNYGDTYGQVQKYIGSRLWGLSWG